MPVAFVLARIEEAEALSELRRRVWATTYRGIYPDEMIDDFDYAFHNERNRLYISSGGFSVYFIVAGEERLGYLILRKGAPFQLQSLYLVEEYRGKGIGTQAFAFIRRCCRDHGHAGFVLSCHPDNTAALAFYAKMGGVIIRRDVGHPRNEENGVLLQFQA